MTSRKNIEFRISKIKLDLGDVLVFKTPLTLRPEFVEALRKQLQHAFPGVKGFVLENGMELAVIKESDLAKLARLRRRGEA